MDLLDLQRRVVSYAISRRVDARLALAALRAAVVRRELLSDRGKLADGGQAAFTAKC